MNLKMLFWDREIDENILKKILSGEIKNQDDLTKEKIYIRMLNSWNWYDILDFVSPKKISELLSIENIDKLYPKKIKEKYLYAREILSGISLSASK
jgi:hypothetical protein